MKIFIVILVVLILAFLAVQFFAWRSQSNIESYPYTIIESYDHFEIRKYEASLFTAVTIPTNKYREGANKGFSALAGYIFGDNAENEKIAMTSPVAMSLDDTMKVMFLVPKKYKASSLPTPNKSNVTFEEMPDRKVAAITFGGWANDDKIKFYRKKLTDALDANHIRYSNKFYFLGYNPPYEVFNRKNEVIVDIE